MRKMNKKKKVLASLIILTIHLRQLKKQIK